MNHLQFFIKHEESKIRGDKNEGTSHIYHSAKVSFNNMQIGGVESVAFRKKYLDNINILCLCGFAKDGKLSIDEQFQELGDKAIVITNPLEFFSRLKKSLYGNSEISILPEEDYFFRPIEYMPNNHNGYLGLFRKSRKYSWQNEWRIAVLRRNKEYKPEPYVLIINPINDLCHILNTKDIIADGINIQSISNIPSEGF